MKGERVVVTGAGIVAASAIGVPAFASALRDGRSGIRQLGADSLYPGLPAAWLDPIPFEDLLGRAPGAASPFATRAKRIGRRSPRTVQVALLAALEAVTDARAGSDETELERCGVVVGGQNLNPRYASEQAALFAASPDYLSPAYALHSLDTDHVGAISEVFGARGEGMTVGGASASGNVAIVHAMRLVRAGYLDSCLVVGAMTDLSAMELKAFESLGALAGERYAGRPTEACRPFDRDREGFVYGQSCACLMLESATRASARGARAWGEVLGGAVALDGNRSTEPSGRGEARAMRQALGDAGLSAERVDYLNAHGTSSRIGDPTELEAIADVFGAHLSRLWINSTKGLVGHGISAAGVVEAVATLIQMREGFVHPNANLENPLRDDVRFAPKESVAADLRVAMSNSFGFGGFNASIVLGRE